MGTPEEDARTDLDVVTANREDVARLTGANDDNEGNGDHNDDSGSSSELEKGHGTPSSSTSSSAEAPPPPSRCRAIWRRVVAIYWEHEFLILVIASIGLARAYPPLGAIYVAPNITASWIAVIITFLLAGISLKTSELSNAFKNVAFNAYLQVFNFGVVSALVYGLSRLLVVGHVLGEDLANGMTIASCLPMTINTVVVMTKAAGGDEASAVFNAAFGSMIGVFLSPALILGYIGVTGNVNVADTFYKLAARVLLPVVVGQVLQYAVPSVKNFKKYNRQVQQYAIVFIAYTVFAEQFMHESKTAVGSIFIMIAIVILVLIVIMALAWYSMKLLFPNQPKLRVMGLFGGTHKTIAMGLPLISAIYEGSPNVGLYSLPLLCWHPLQLVLGSLVTPRLLAFVEREEARLGLNAEPRDATEVDEASSSPPADSIRAAEEGRSHSSAVAPATAATILMTGSMEDVEAAASPVDEDCTDSSRGRNSISDLSPHPWSQEKTLRQPSVVVMV